MFFVLQFNRNGMTVDAIIAGPCSCDEAHEKYMGWQDANGWGKGEHDAVVVPEGIVEAMTVHGPRPGISF